jgi:hypothetical protein
MQTSKTLDLVKAAAVRPSASHKKLIPIKDMIVECVKVKESAKKL